MSQFQWPPDLVQTIRDLKTRVQGLENSSPVRSYTTSTRPASTNLTAGVIIFVSDAAAGSQFQGWNGVSWVSLG